LRAEFRRMVLVNRLVNAHRTGTIRMSAKIPPRLEERTGFLGKMRFFYAIVWAGPESAGRASASTQEPNAARLARTHLSHPGFGLLCVLQVL
jgi:hypothetical protein